MKFQKTLITSSIIVGTLAVFGGGLAVGNLANNGSANNVRKYGTFKVAGKNYQIDSSDLAGDLYGSYLYEELGNSIALTNQQLKDYGYTVTASEINEQVAAAKKSTGSTKNFNKMLKAQYGNLSNYKRALALAARENAYIIDLLKASVGEKTSKTVKVSKSLKKQLKKAVDKQKTSYVATMKITGFVFTSSASSNTTGKLMAALNDEKNHKTLSVKSFAAKHSSLVSNAMILTPVHWDSVEMSARGISSNIIQQLGELKSDGEFHYIRDSSSSTILIVRKDSQAKWNKNKIPSSLLTTIANQIVEGSTSSDSTGLYNPIVRNLRKTTDSKYKNKEVKAVMDNVIEGSTTDGE